MYGSSALWDVTLPEHQYMDDQQYLINLEECVSKVESGKSKVPTYLLTYLPTYCSPTLCQVE